VLHFTLQEIYTAFYITGNRSAKSCNVKFAASLCSFLSEHKSANPAGVGHKFIVSPPYEVTLLWGLVPNLG